MSLLGGRRLHSKTELIEGFDVSDRTPYSDLDGLGRCNVPVTRLDGGYRLVEGATLRPRAMSLLYASLTGGAETWRDIDPYQPFRRGHS